MHASVVPGLEPAPGYQEPKHALKGEAGWPISMVVMGACGRCSDLLLPLSIWLWPRPKGLRVRPITIRASGKPGRGAWGNTAVWLSRRHLGTIRS
jgi:hypothetical protein